MIWSSFVKVYKKQRGSDLLFISILKQKWEYQLELIADDNDNNKIELSVLVRALSESDITFSLMLIAVSNNIINAANRGSNFNKQSEQDSKSDWDDLKNSEAEKLIKTTSQAESEDETHQDLDSDSESNSAKMSSLFLNHYKIININKSLPASSNKNESIVLNLVGQNMVTASHKWGQSSK